MGFWAGGNAEMESVQGFRVSEVCVHFAAAWEWGEDSDDDGADIASGVVEPGIRIVSTFTTMLEEAQSTCRRCI
jgi:hypothetical protein